MRALPILTPCHESFDAMTGDADAKTRHCAECDKDVHDLSAGTEAEAAALLARAGKERVCIRYARDASGNVHFRAAMAVAAVAAAAAMAACSAADTTTPVAAQPMATPHPDGGADVNERLEVLMGEYVADPEPEAK